jgi:hypothetical protein|tara:strand:+ start:110 stop:316 length:207 start_codon:yes stop_codon:yes gene_type:complete
MKKIRVDGYSHLYRDVETGAIVNCDNSSYKNYVNSLKKDKIKKQELDNMKQDIEDIKGALKEILNRLA